VSASLAARSFSYPFQRRAGRAWLIGVPLAFFCPIGIIPLLGYSVAATRKLVAQQDDGLPAWRLDGRLLLDGGGLFLLLVLVTSPFFAAAVAASGRLAAVLPVGDPFLARAYAVLAVAGPVALLWALAALLIVPTGLARYAAGGRLRDLFNIVASLRLARRRFWAWNLAGVPIVTAWAVCLFALLAGGVGAPFAAFCAILVSAHASSTLAESR